MLMGDDPICNMDEIGIVLIKMINGMVKELKDVTYIPQIKKNLISIGALKTPGLEFYGRDGVLKMLKGSIVVLKGVKCIKLHYLKGNTIIGQLMTSVGLVKSQPGYGI